MAATKHGQANEGKKTRAYVSWVNMKQRCYNPNRPDYRYYGGRGVTVCDRWQESYANFYDDMGDCPDGHTLDKIDNSKGYSPENCRWADRWLQSNNRDYNVLVEYRGKKQTIGQWARELPIYISTKNLYKRVFTRGWELERAFTQPCRSTG